jgi:hypothetical protein
MEDEANGNPMSFPILLLTIVKDRLLYRPQSHNSTFATGSATSQHILRFGPNLRFWGSTRTLRQFALAKMATYNDISLDNVAVGWPATRELVVELLRVQYTPRQLERPFLSHAV